VAAQKVCDEIRANGGDAVPSFTVSPGGIALTQFIDDAIKAYGRLDVVVNNAAVLRDVIFHKMSDSGLAHRPRRHAIRLLLCLAGAANLFQKTKQWLLYPYDVDVGIDRQRRSGQLWRGENGVAGLSKCIALDLARFKVRSNCIAPFAYTRLTATIPGDTEQNRARIAVLKTMTANKIAPFAVSLMTDDAADITGQIFSVRSNEIVLYTQPRPFRTAQTSDGWTPESCVKTALPALRPSMYPCTSRRRSLRGTHLNGTSRPHDVREPRLSPSVQATRSAKCDVRE